MTNNRSIDPLINSNGDSDNAKGECGSHNRYYTLLQMMSLSPGAYDILSGQGLE